MTALQDFKAAIEAIRQKAAFPITNGSVDDYYMGCRDENSRMKAIVETLIQMVEKQDKALLKIANIKEFQASSWETAWEDAGAQWGHLISTAIESRAEVLAILKETK